MTDINSGMNLYIFISKMSAMDWFVPLPQNSYVEAWTPPPPPVTVFGDGASEEIITVKYGHKGATLIGVVSSLEATPENSLSAPFQCPLNRGHMRTKF